MRRACTARRSSLTTSRAQLSRGQERLLGRRRMLSLVLALLCQLVTGPAHELLHAAPGHVEQDGDSDDGCVHLRAEGAHDAGLHEQHPCLSCHAGRAVLALDGAPALLQLDLLQRDRLPPARPDRDHSAVPEGILGARGPPAPSA